MQSPSEETEYSEQEQTEIWQRRFDTLREMRQRTTPTDHARRSEDRYVVIRCADQRFAIPLKTVSEVLPLTVGQKGTMVPEAPAAFWGLLLVRGEVRPVFDFQQLLSVSASSTDPWTDTNTGHIVFVRLTYHGQDRETVGLKVDRVENIIVVSEADAHSTQAGGVRPSRFVQRVQTDDADARSLFFLDVTALLTYLRGDTPESSASIVAVETETMLLQSDTLASSGIEED